MICGGVVKHLLNCFISYVVSPGTSLYSAWKAHSAALRRVFLFITQTSLRPSLCRLLKLSLFYSSFQMSMNSSTKPVNLFNVLSGPKAPDQTISFTTYNIFLSKSHCMQSIRVCSNHKNSYLLNTTGGLLSAVHSHYVVWSPSFSTYTVLRIIFCKLLKYSYNGAFLKTLSNYTIFHAINSRNAHDAPQASHFARLNKGSSYVSLFRFHCHYRKKGIAIVR